MGNKGARGDIIYGDRGDDGPPGIDGRNGLFGSKGILLKPIMIIDF